MKQSTSAPQIASDRTLVPRGLVVSTGLGFGLTADLLIEGTPGPGLNLLLLFTALAGAILLVGHRSGRPLSREARGWLAVGLVFALAFVLRSAPALQTFSFLLAAAAFAFPALRSGGAWLKGSGISHPIEAIGGAVLNAVLGPLRLLLDSVQGEGGSGSADPGSSPPPLASPRRSLVGSLLRGLLLALPLLLLFGALFMGADPAFANGVNRLFRGVDMDRLGAHLAFTGILSWLATGYLAGLVRGTGVRRWLQPLLPRLSLGVVEVGTALGLVALLFLAFVVVQLQTLFGGPAFVEITPGLTYAEYTRDGFEQLVVAAGLVLPLLLASDWLLRRESPRDERIFRGLGAAQIALLLVIIASALHRVQSYQAAYGLTEARFYGAAFLGWLTLLSLWFAASLLRGQRERFAPVALGSAFAFVLVLLLLNPDARIVQSNLNRGGDFDASYAGSLSADAVPLLVGALPSLTPEARCPLAGALVQRWGTHEDPDWRSWNWADARARRAIAEAPAASLSTAGCIEGEA
jgi:hypothetical protein